MWIAPWLGASGPPGEWDTLASPPTNPGRAASTRNATAFPNSTDPGASKPLRVFSASIESFLGRLTVLARKILREDFGVRVGRTRFRTADGWSWPILLVAIDDAGRHGYFDPRDCTIAVHKRLMYTAKDRVLENLLRHELAHYFTYIEHHESGLDERIHGPQFQRICDAYGLPPEVRRASSNICAENEAIEGELENEAVIGRFRRLMSLAQSDNEHEAALAVLRANELMVRHNLDATAALGADAGEIEYCVRVVLECKRSSPRISAIAAILREFVVYPVQGSDGLEVTGTRANVEQAEYVAKYLDRALAAAWKHARSAHRGRRLLEKPFMAAAADAYVEKLQRAKSRLSSADQRALVALDRELQWACHGAYAGGVRHTTSSYRSCGVSTSQGARAGAELSIHPGVGGRSSLKLIGG
jgi:hypothetical protein